ncbi:unnamed protein product [Protopolystoma xenopodis]|uniref:Uncharacterized protein n=1 Tax=Protopolystoma xenopodis TaxID=117903 RepID=A0A3S4ZKW6_9PLAT|nr:unnamed protein product [Protopolystoma xenopodis]
MIDNTPAQTSQHAGASSSSSVLPTSSAFICLPSQPKLTCPINPLAGRDSMPTGSSSVQVPGDSFRFKRSRPLLLSEKQRASSPLKNELHDSNSKTGTIQGPTGDNGLVLLSQKSLNRKRLESNPDVLHCHEEAVMPLTSGGMSSASRRAWYERGSVGRRTTECVVLRLSQVYFRQARFPPTSKLKSDLKLINSMAVIDSDTPQQQQLANSDTKDSNPHNSDARQSTSCDHWHISPPSQPDSRYVIRIGELLITDRVSASRVNQLLYPLCRTSEIIPVCYPPTDTSLAMLRATLVYRRISPSLAPRVLAWPKSVGSDRKGVQAKRRDELLFNGGKRC